MTTGIIITLCTLLLLAYVFDISASKTKIPSVILLLLLGVFVRQVLEFLNFNMPDLNPVLPILGTIGLILIVLEGAMELEIEKNKRHLIFKSISVAVISILILSIGFSYFMTYYYSIPFKTALLNAIPFTVISSAIAIPTAKKFPHAQKEFITYETSISDIFGLILFNFILLNDVISTITFVNFGIQLILMLLISGIATFLLSLLLNRIKHSVKFVPIILLLVLIYSISKHFHLPSLVFVLLFGLTLSNVESIKRIPFFKDFNLNSLEKEIIRFKEICIELTFLIRALFFLIFGFLIDLNDLLNTETLFLSIIISLSIFCVRLLLLLIHKQPLKSLLFIAPRGLITILLFLSLPASYSLPWISNSLIVQVIFITAFTMMLGMKPIKTDE